MGIRQSESSSGLTTHYLTDPNRDYAQVIEESFDLNSFAELTYTYGDGLISQYRRVDALTTSSSTNAFSLVRGRTDERRLDADNRSLNNCDHLRELICLY